MPAEHFEKLIAREHQLGNHGHELIERVDAHPKRMARRPRVGRAGRFNLDRLGSGLHRPLLAARRLLPAAISASWPMRSASSPGGSRFSSSSPSKMVLIR